MARIPAPIAPPPGLSLVQVTQLNEKTKFITNVIGNAATAFIAIGLITPLVAIGFGSTTAPELNEMTVITAITWSLTGLVLTEVAVDNLSNLI